MSLHLSELVDEIAHEIGYALDKDESDPQLLIEINGLIIAIDTVTIRTNEIIFKPRIA